jgi:hypothetical protein
MTNLSCALSFCQTRTIGEIERKGRQTRAQCVHVRNRERQIEIENAGGVDGYHQPHMKRGVRRQVLINSAAWPHLSIGVWFGWRSLEPTLTGGQDS